MRERKKEGVNDEGVWSCFDHGGGLGVLWGIILGISFPYLSGFDAWTLGNGL